jgi:hypothetical protein
VVFFFVLYALFCQFLWIVHFLIALRYSLTFISLCSRHRDKHNVSHIDLQSVLLMDHQRFPIGIQWFSMVQWFSIGLYYFFLDRTHRSFPVGFIFFMWVLRVFILVLDIFCACIFEILIDWCWMYDFFNFEIGEEKYGSMKGRCNIFLISWPRDTNAYQRYITMDN